MSPSRKFFDYFLFNNEIELLNYRLEILDEAVDYFLLVESPFTFTGKPKELFYEKNIDLFKKYSSKIVHSVFEDFPYNDYVDGERVWKNEIANRNGGLQLSIVNLSKDKGIVLNQNDIIGISDVDEIWNPHCINNIRKDELQDVIYSPKMELYYYNFLQKFSEPWIHPKIVLGKRVIDGELADDIRRGSGILIEDGGWHLSYFGDVDFIIAKLEAFSHQEFNTFEIKNRDRIEKSIAMGIDLFGRDDARMAKNDFSNMPPQWEKLNSLQAVPRK